MACFQDVELRQQQPDAARALTADPTLKRPQMSSAKSAAPANANKRLKRVPWRSRQDLVELYSLIWDDWLNEEQRRRGLSRVGDRLLK